MLFVLRCRGNGPHNSGLITFKNASATHEPLPTHYSVDRRNLYKVGQQFRLTHPDQLDLSPPLRAYLSEFLPGGLSDHGLTYLLLPFMNPDAAQELVWESVRRAHYRHRPSRLQSVFGWETLDGAMAFAQRFPGCPVYELEAPEVFKANMALLSVRTHPLQVSMFAHAYWRGEQWPAGHPGEVEPQWEFLMPAASTTVVRQLGIWSAMWLPLHMEGQLPLEATDGHSEQGQQGASA